MKRIFTAWCAGTMMLLPTLSAYGADTVIPPVSWDFQTLPEEISVINNEDGTPTFEYVDWRKCYVYETSYGDSPASDMLVLPPLQLKAGKTYGLTYSAYASWYRFDWDPTLSWVIAPTPEQLPQGTAISGATAFTSSYDPETHTFTFEVESDGTYSIAALLNAGEAQGSGNFYLCSIALDGGISANAPVDPELSVTPVIRDGALSMDIQLTAPSASLSGTTLSGPLTYNISNSDGRFSRTGSINAGETVVLADDGCDAAGETYTAAVSSGDETGQTATVKCVPEFDRPAAPANVRTTLQEDGSLLIEWDPVTEGASGGLFNPATVVYSVQRNDRRTIATKIGETHVSDTPAVPEDGQAAYSYTVSAYGDSKSYYYSSAESEEIILGNPYRGELKESFDNGDATTSVWSYGPADASSSAWNPSTSNYSSPSCREDSDGTGGFLLFNPSYYDGLEYRSPLIDMTGSVNPRLSMDIYRYSTAPEQPFVTLWVEADGVRTPVENGTLSFNAASDGWESVEFPLPSCVAEKPFRLLLEGAKVNGQAYKAIVDNIVIRDIKAIDAALEAMAAGTTPMPGQTLEISATAVNNGSDPLENLYVSVSLNSEELERSETFSLTSGQKETLTIPVYITPFLAGSDHDITLTVHADGDLDTSNNSLTSHISVGTHTLPYATPLSAVHTSTGALISWQAPELPIESMSTPATESFEDIETGSTDAPEGWIFIDADGKDKNGLAGINTDRKFAFFTAEKFSTSAASTLTAADGSKSLVATRASDYSGIDVWLISPCIDPSVPVSFQTTGIGFRGAESASFEFGYLPVGSENVSDFVKTSDVETSGYSWETITETLPAGAGRFAIHIVDVLSYGVALDDFRFNALAKPPVLNGYNIWRNRKPVGFVTPENTSWTDPEADRKADNLYHISCVYHPDKEVMENEGIMLAANNVPDSVESITSSAGWELHGNVIATNENVTVYDMRGTRVAEAQASVSITLAPGIYIVKGETRIEKIIVK